VKGDILIDDKPMDILNPLGKHNTAAWRRVIFDQPYNRSENGVRLVSWNCWKRCILPLLGINGDFSETYTSNISKPEYHTTPLELGFESNNHSILRKSDFEDYNTTSEDITRADSALIEKEKKKVFDANTDEVF
jgi:hypothetical protein